MSDKDFKGKNRNNSRRQHDRSDERRERTFAPKVPPSGNGIYGSLQRLCAYRDDWAPDGDHLLWIYSRESNSIWIASGWRFHDWHRRTHGKYILDELGSHVQEYLDSRLADGVDPWVVHVEAIAISKALRCSVANLKVQLPPWNVKDPSCTESLDEYFRARMKMAYVIAEQDILPSFWVIRRGYDIMLDRTSEESLSPAIFLTKDACSQAIIDFFANRGRPVRVSGEKEWARFYSYEDDPDQIAALATVVRFCDVQRFTKAYVAQVERQLLINTFLMSRTGSGYAEPSTDTPKEMLARIFNSVFASVALPWIVDKDLQLDDACLELPF